VQTGIEDQNLTAEDQIFILTQAVHLTATRGLATPEARVCYEHAETLCQSLDRPLALYSALMGQWLVSNVTANLTAAMAIAQRLYSLAQKQNDPALLVGAYRAIAGTWYFRGNFETAERYARRGVQLWHAESVQPQVEEVLAPAVACHFYDGLSGWHLGEIASSRANIAEAVSLAKELNDTYALAAALHFAGFLGHFERNPSEVKRLASELIELSTRQVFPFWLAGGQALRGWAWSASGNTAEGIAWIAEGIADWRTTGGRLVVPYWLALKAEALHVEDRIPDALETIREAEALADASGEHWWRAELYRLRGIFLAAMGADESQIETAFDEAIHTAQQQKSISLKKRAEATRAAYRRQKASGPKGRGFRLPLC
jgi:tetratricopeptide (TPR) repeat protein